MDAHAEPGLSIVVPIHNEEECIAELGRRLTEVADGLPETAEFVLVDDGSTDDSPALIRELAATDPRFRFLQLSRSFGHQIALTAGLEAARGRAVVTMDGDLQHPPEYIPAFLDRWREGYDVVYGVMEERVVPTRFKSWSAKAFYRILRSMTDVTVAPAAGDFRLVDRRVLDEFLRLREHHRYLRGMFSWLGYRQIGVDYASPARFGGESKYTLWMMIGLAADALLSFSKSPLRFVIKVAFGVALLSLLFAAGSVLSKLFGVYNAPGYVSIIAVMVLLGAMQLIVLGVMGEYLERIFEEVKGRPLYLVADASDGPLRTPPRRSG
jgi:glycosyltransferase involved in cell wall biosynthesis